MKKLLIVLLAFVMIFSLAACGGQEETKVYLVGTEPTFPPFEFTNDAGEIIGFDIDLIKAIAEDQGFEVEIKNLGFDGLIMAVQSENIDIIASGMTITEEREENVDFSTPYINAGLALAVAHGDDAIQSADDLKGKKVAVQIGTTGANEAQRLMDEGIVADVVTFNTVDVVMMELVNGGVDAVINDLPVTKAYMTKQPDKIQLVGEPLTSESYGFAVAEGNEELLEMINTGLQNVIDDGTYDEIQAKYFEAE
ncbi:MAG: transporter substrate-binding domain-containing protein [Clostridia bacterium]|nr:transporter substrate-binding domain-containing protein [Clostridia bacterium]